MTMINSNPVLEPLPARERGGCPVTALFGPPDESGATRSLTHRVGVFGFGLLAYAMFFGTILYAIGFVSGLLVPKTLNTGEFTSPLLAIPINAVLLMLFVVQHTIMARPAFKRWWTRIVPPAAERSIFVALASGCLMLLFWQWRPLPGVIWDLSGMPVARYGLTAIGLVGWAIVFASSFMVSHWDLFGLRQVSQYLLNRADRPIAFRLVGFYRLVRHPLMVGFLIAFWSTPLMTVGHLFFAAMTTLYIIFGTWIEERDLVAQFGDVYREYQARVRGFIPIPRRGAGRG